MPTRTVCGVGAHAAVEQDDAERDRADQVGELDVVEEDAAGAVFAGEHAQQQEYQQQRRAGTRQRLLTTMLSSTSSAPIRIA